MLKVVHISIYAHGRGGGMLLNSVNFYGAKNCSTVIQARDAFIKMERADYSADRIPGDEPASEAIRKFPFRSDLVGYYAFEDGLNFIFPEEHPVYKLVQSKNYDDKDLADKLADLFDYHYKQHEGKRKRVAA